MCSKINSRWFMSTFLYNVSATYDANCAAGPAFNGEIPKWELPPESEWVDFFGKRVYAPKGIPAGPLLNSQWTDLAFKLGAPIALYKTIRAEEKVVNGFPNVCFINAEMFDPQNPPKLLHTLKEPPTDLTKTAITNSFGMPSKGAAYLAEDIPRAIAQAGPGQALVVSIVGTDEKEFIAAALLAKKCGAEIIEANYSCPNVCSKEGQLYLDPDLVETYSKGIIQALDKTPLLIKVGSFKSNALMEKVFIAAAKAGVQGICGINTVAVEVQTPEGAPALDEKRKVSGVCGYPIRETALAFAKEARNIITKNGLQLKLIAGGGITEKSHFDEFLKYADFAMCGTGWFADPYIFI